MGLFEKFSRLFRANLNDLVNKAEDPVKILDQSLVDMQEDLVKLRQAVALAITSQKRLLTKADQSNEQVKSWYERAQLAIKNDDEALAREALMRKKTFQESSDSLRSQVEAQEGQVEKLKKALLSLEGKIAEAITKKDMLKARAQAAKAQQQLNNAVENIGGNSAMAAFERMEEKVELLEASGEAAAELTGADLESKFSALENKNNDDIDNELNLLRTRLKNGVESVALPPSENMKSVLSDAEEEKIDVVNVSEVDEELEELKRSIDNL
tara:strand:+ start:19401 stop:20207 length:807 start_codon:yes stop_codon:yes gene_type:complete